MKTILQNAVVSSLSILAISSLGMNAAGAPYSSTVFPCSISGVVRRVSYGNKNYETQTNLGNLMSNTTISWEVLEMGEIDVYSTFLEERTVNLKISIDLPLTNVTYKVDPWGWNRRAGMVRLNHFDCSFSFSGGLPQNYSEGFLSPSSSIDDLAYYPQWANQVITSNNAVGGHQTIFADFYADKNHDENAFKPNYSNFPCFVGCEVNKFGQINGNPNSQTIRFDFNSTDDETQTGNAYERLRFTSANTGTQPINFYLTYSFAAQSMPSSLDLDYSQLVSAGYAVMWDGVDREYPVGNADANQRKITMALD
jgi:hypothetical protein